MLDFVQSGSQLPRRQLHSTLDFPFRVELGRGQRLQQGQIERVPYEYPGKALPIR